ncbi:MAG: hypothetical protein M1814_003367 [Vezdaea aestivalis]|nr:MAG: hypothetical protein M1814_003367 [Vezdaea aestivalis]
MSTATTSAPPAATTSGQSGGNNSPPASSPLLFFVALGFGVVFTNLWIIVGVKYCFRYNQRNRQMRAEENGDIDMAAMPRPHRRRREKKLMTMDEVNLRFPLKKYQEWRKSRETEGLPAVGGVTAPGSRAGSVRGVAAIIDPVKAETTPAKETRKSMDTPPAADGPSVPVVDKRFSKASDLEKGPIAPPPTETKPLSHVPDLQKTNTATTSMAEEEEEEDDHIHTAVPPELLTNLGDSCAICLDTLEDEDDVRGLTCGHAFHAPCVDPWLTTRRACCPLCKADYYVPKPRPEGEEGNDERPNRRHGNGPHMPTAPHGVWTVSSGQNLFRSRMILPGRPGRAMSIVPAGANDRHGFPVVERDGRGRTVQHGDVLQTGESGAGSEQATPQSRTWRSRLFAGSNRGQPSTETQAPTETSYSADTTPPIPDGVAQEPAPRSRFSIPARFRRQRQLETAAPEVPAEITPPAATADPQARS